MRTLLLILAGLVALLAAGAWLIPLLFDHLPGVAGLLGVALLLVALFLPGKPKCSGMHCSGCKHH